MKDKAKINQLEYDLKNSRYTVKRMHQRFNKILDILFSSLSSEEKNKQIGWEVINEKIDDSIN